MGSTSQASVEPALIMCGIAGWVSSDGSVDAQLLAAMRQRLAHRGPDDAGLWVCSDRSVGLAHRRLSIIDLSSRAAQPMFARRRSLGIVYNGEIYNHRDLRKELEEGGTRFETDHSDTETLLHGYHSWGRDGLLRRLNGMFAFALFDERRREVLMVRDRLGIKPFYYGRFGPHFLFASEVKALLRHPVVSADVDWPHLPCHLMFRAVPAPRTLFRGIRKLRPGEWLTLDVDTGRVRRALYWDPLQQSTHMRLSADDAANRLAELLRSSVRLRLESDVPVGVFLSAGMDSNFIARQVARERELKTFTVSYPGHAEFNESGQAAQQAQTLGADHHEVAVDPVSFGAILPTVTFFQDEPSIAPVSASMYFLADAARHAGVPVILTGEGSDELFVGYRRWLHQRDMQRLLSRLGPLVQGPLRVVGPALRSLLGPLAPHPEIVRRAAAGQPVFWGGALDFPLDFQRRLLRKNAPGLDIFDGAVAGFREEFLRRAQFRSDITGWMSYIDLRFRLPELMLPRLDRMGMAWSIEGRVPFLDHRVVEFVMALDPECRAASGRVSKPLLKAALATELDDRTLRRPKRGFMAPVALWSRQPVAMVLKDFLRRFARQTGVFRSGPLETVLAAHGNRLYFSLLSFMVWHTIFIEDLFEGGLWESMDRVAGSPIRRPWEA